MPAGANGVIAPLSGESTGTSLLVQDNEVTVLTLNGLAANTDYVVNAKVQAGNGSALRIDCTLTRGGTELDTALWDPSDSFSGTTLALQDVSTGAGTSIVLTCEAGGGGGTARTARSPRSRSAEHSAPDEVARQSRRRPAPAALVVDEGDGRDNPHRFATPPPDP